MFLRNYWSCRCLGRRDQARALRPHHLRRPDRSLLNLKIDAGGVHARRIVDRELAKSSPASAA